MSLNNFIVVSKLGQGSFGRVQKVRRIQNNQQYALKTVKYMDLKQKDKKNALNQIRLLASITHPNIIQYKEAFFDEKQKKLCTVMQLASGGDLAAKIKSKIQKNQVFYQYQIWAIGKDIINGLYALHERNIIHRDIKPANIFFGSGNIAKIGDMNVSLLMKDSFAYTQTGTPYYASPQVWANQPYRFECDIWSFGCIIYEMCCLRKPFEAKNIQKLYEKIKKLRYDPVPYRYSYDLATVIQKCLTSRQNRINLQELKKIFQIHTAPQSFISNQSSKQNKSSQNLMGTIKMPYNKNDFPKMLPKPKYDPILYQNQNQISSTTSLQQPISKPSVLDYFISPNKKLPVHLKQPRSQKNLNNYPYYLFKSNSRSEIECIQSPSFKQAISIHSPSHKRQQLIQNKIDAQNLKLKKRKIKITIGGY